MMTRQWSEAEQWCAQGYQRFADDWLFSFCQLTLLYMPSPQRADADKAWRLVSQLERVTPPSERRVLWPRWRMMTAGVLARAGATDSARHTREAARKAVWLGERDGAMRLLERYISFSPDSKAFIRGDPVFEPLKDKPRFQALVATAP
jgi:hypothetical protein